MAFVEGVDQGWIMNSIPIFIPVVNRLDLLRKAIDSVPISDKWQIEVINNTGSTLPEDLAAGDCNPSVPLTASQTLNWMNHLAKAAFDAPFYFFMHNDAEAGPDTVERLYEITYRKHCQRDRWGVVFTHYDTLAAFNTEAIDAVGGWDTNLPQYFTDNCMYRRLRLAGYELAESCLPVKHEGSQTIHSDPLRELVNSITFPIYTRYYAAKWGGEPGRETFLTPFGWPE